MIRSLWPFGVLLALAACDSSSSSAPIPPQPSGPPPVVPDPSWPELPPGVGKVGIDMGGDWEITSVSTTTWEPSPWVRGEDPLGQMFTIGPHSTVTEYVELVDFAWYQPVSPASNYNEGDGKFLLYSYSSQFANPPGTVGGAGYYVLLSMGSAGPDTLVGHYQEFGMTFGLVSEFEIDFEFTAERR